MTQLLSKQGEPIIMKDFSDITILLPPSSYKRTTLNPIDDYRQSMSMQLRTSYGADQVQIDDFLDRIERDKRVPIVKIHHRANNGDKSSKKVPLDRYIKGLRSSRLIVAPTLTSYLRKEQRLSPITGMVTEGMKVRGDQKKKAFDAKTRGDEESAQFYSVFQVATKTGNNQVSGATDCGGTIIQNPSLHSTLTSTTRLATSITNVTVERAISGTRHYSGLNVVMSNIIYSQIHAESIGEDVINQTISHYALQVPSVTDCLDVIKKNILSYVRKPDLTEITDYLTKISPASRAVFVYSGDTSTLRRLNDAFFREVYTRLLCLKRSPTLIENSHEKVKGLPDELKGYLHHRFYKETMNRGTIYEQMPAQLTSDMWVTALHFREVYRDYKELFVFLFRTPLLSPEVAHYKSMVRDAILVNDTDSGIFTTQDLVTWYQGDKSLITDTGMAVCGLTGYLVVQAVDHQLRNLSANLGVSADDIAVIKMKSEITSTLLSVTANAKHYWCDKAVVEANVLDEKEVSVIYKGVELRSAAKPQAVKDLAAELRKDIILEVRSNKPVDIYHYLKRVIDLENHIRERLSVGDLLYTSSIDIKPSDSYKIVDPFKNNAIWYKFWTMTYGKAYQHDIPEEYRAVVIKTTLKSKKTMEAWITSIEDTTLRANMEEFLRLSGRSKMDVIRIPQTYARTKGLPPDLVPFLATEDIITAQCGMLYMTLESLGLYKNPTMTWGKFMSGSAAP